MIATERAEIIPLLAILELDFDKLIDAVRYADSDRALCTANDPRGFDLITMNARTARALRETFCGERWKLDETDNQAGIRNPHNKVRVIHCNFDLNCSHPTNNPTNVTEKGAASRLKVAANQPVLPGFEIPDEQQGAEYTTWVLGTHYEKHEGVVLAELSRPLNFSSGRYTKFADRIIILDGSEGADAGAGIRPDREGPTEVIDIPIARK